jgi:outer membrane immunogenic protein
VFGAELSGSWTNIKGHTPCLIVLTCATEHNWLVTAAGRFGVAWNQTLVYVKRGVAWADPQYSASLALWHSILRCRRGVRVPCSAPALSRRSRAAGRQRSNNNYIEFGTSNLNFPVTVVRLPINVATDVNEKMHTIKFGLNYRFGGYGPVGY